MHEWYATKPSISERKNGKQVKKEQKEKNWKCYKVY